MYNKAVLIGRLTADPELKQTTSGVSVTSFSIAVDRAYTPKCGEKQVDFLDIVAWRGTAEFICKFFSKGKAILVEGSIQTRNYTDKNDNKRKAVEIVAENARFVESKQGSVDDAVPGSAGASQSVESGSAENFTEHDDDGDLPF